MSEKINSKEFALNLIKATIFVLTTWWFIFFSSQDLGEGGQFLAVITGIIIAIIIVALFVIKYGDQEF